MYKLKRTIAASALILSLTIPGYVTTAYANTNYQAARSETAVILNTGQADLEVIDINSKQYINLNNFAEYAGVNIVYAADAINLIVTEPYIPRDKAVLDYEHLEIRPNDKLFKINGEVFAGSVDILKVNNAYYISLDSCAYLTNSSIVYSPIDNYFFLSQGYGYEGIQTLTYSIEENNRQISDFIAKNSIPLNTFDEAAKALDRYDILLVGESHANLKTYDFKLGMIKSAYKAYGVNNIFIEVGYCDSQLVNRYMESGDTGILDMIFGDLKGTFEGNRTAYEFYQRLYEYNQTLDAGKKLRFIGTDVQHQTITGLRYLKSIMPAGDIPDWLRPGMAVLTVPEETFTDLSMVTAALEQLNADIEAQDTAYSDYFGDTYQEFKTALHNICQGVNYISNNRNASLREEYMIENFENYYNELGAAKCLGFYGGYHVPLNRDASGPNQVMASHLNADYPGKIASINLEYINSYSLNPRNQEQPYEMNAAYYFEEAKEYFKTDFTLLKIYYPGSPFLVNEEARDHQYIVIIKDSPAAVPFS